MSETNFDIDAAEDEYNAARGGAPAGGGNPPKEDPKGDPPPSGDDNPPGFLSYDEYIAQGGDPDHYRGRKAFEHFNDRLEENKRLRREVRQMKDTVNQTMDAVTTWQEGEREKIRAEIQADLDRAMEDEDPAAAVAAQKKLDKLEQQQPPKAPPQENPIISDFREANPMIDPDSDDFDAEFEQDLTGFYNNLVRSISPDGRISDGQVKRCLKQAMKQAREFHELEDEPPPRGKAADDDGGESPRNSRKAGREGGGRRQTTSNREAKTPTAEEFTIENPKNGRDTNAAGVRDQIRKTAFETKKKAGFSDEDANKYADEQAANFEKSLAR